MNFANLSFVFYKYAVLVGSYLVLHTDRIFFLNQVVKVFLYPLKVLQFKIFIVCLPRDEFNDK